jgi:hypothetical protein
MTAAFADVERATDSKQFRGLARLGLAARAVIYLLVAWLAVLIARGTPGKEADQRGALQEVASHTGGTVVLWILAAGLIGYSLWRFSEAAFGVTGEGKKAGPRVQSFIRGCIYAFFAVNAIVLLVTSSSGSQAKQQQEWAGKVMTHAAGRWAVGLLGVVVVAVGAFQVYEGLSRKFAANLKRYRMSDRQYRIVLVLGVIGTIARGLVFVVAGVLVVRAALDADAHKARGLDGALRSLAGTAAGPWLLYAAAAGLFVFGLYGLAEAMWRRT